jgi:hypothetical protein
VCVSIYIYISFLEKTKEDNGALVQTRLIYI